MANFVIGKGTKVRIALLPLGDQTEPLTATLTTGASPTVKDTSSPATITLSGPIGDGVKIPAGNYLSFKAPTTGKLVLVKLAADAIEGASSLSVDVIPEEIAASSVAAFPLRLSGRTSANLDRSGNRTSAVDFDSDGYSTGLTTSIEQKLTLNGNWLPSDAGFATAEHAFAELREVYVWLELPRISDAYSKGRIYHGPASIDSLPLEVAADGIITGNIEITFNGRPSYTPDLPV